MRLVLFRQPGVEDAAEVDVARGSAGPDDDALPRAYVHRAADRAVHVVDLLDRDPEDATRILLLPMDTGHPLPEEDLHALASRAPLERTDQPGPRGAATDLFIPIGPDPGDRSSRRPIGGHRPPDRPERDTV